MRRLIIAIFLFSLACIRGPVSAQVTPSPSFGGPASLQQEIHAGVAQQNIPPAS